VCQLNKQFDARKIVVSDNYMALALKTNHQHQNNASNHTSISTFNWHKSTANIFNLTAINIEIVNVLGNGNG
jgi:hypothetical protein